MNIILLSDRDFLSSSRARVSVRQLDHIMSVLKSKAGDQLKVGKVGGKLGIGRVISTGAAIELDVHLTEMPPQPSLVTLIMPMIRPLMFKRILFHAVTLGIKKIILLNFSRVEKSLWNSSTLEPAAMQEQIILGLEQAGDTILPDVIIRDRFKPFVEDELPALIQGQATIVAHPGGTPCPRDIRQPITVVIGPEGGLIPYELEQLTAIGFNAVDLGSRILRVETALPFILGRLSP